MATRCVAISALLWHVPLLECAPDFRNYRKRTIVDVEGHSKRRKRILSQLGPSDAGHLPELKERVRLSQVLIGRLN